MRYLIGMLIGAALVYAAMMKPARSHDAGDVWEDGSKVDPITKKSCCGPGDCHSIGTDRVHFDEHGNAHVNTSGLAWTNRPEFFIPMERVQPSPAHGAWLYWLCASGQDTPIDHLTGMPMFFCFFAPLNF